MNSFELRKETVLYKNKFIIIALIIICIIVVEELDNVGIYVSMYNARGLGIVGVFQMSTLVIFIVINFALVS